MNLDDIYQTLEKIEKAGYVLEVGELKLFIIL